MGSSQGGAELSVRSSQACGSACGQSGSGKMDGLRSWGQDGQHLGLSSQGTLPGSGQAPPEIRGQASSSNLIAKGLLREAAKGYTVSTTWNLQGSHFWHKTCCQQLPELGSGWGSLKFILHPHRWCSWSCHLQNLSITSGTAALSSCSPSKATRAAGPFLSTFRL